MAIEAIGTVPREAHVPERNGFKVSGRRGDYVACPHRLPSGRIEIRKAGNDVRARTEGVARFRLLISPSVFDLTASIRVGGRIPQDF